MCFSWYSFNHNFIMRLNLRTLCSKDILGSKRSYLYGCLVMRMNFIAGVMKRIYYEFDLKEDLSFRCNQLIKPSMANEDDRPSSLLYSRKSYS